MQRKKMLIAVLALALLIGVASAAILTYYGRIVGTVTVDQAVVVDGKDITEMPITEPLSVMGGETVESWHNIQDLSSQAIWVKIYSAGVSAPGNDWTGVSVTYGFALSTSSGTTSGEEVDILSMRVEISWGAFSTVSYAYKIRSGSAHKWAPFVVLLVDVDGDGVEDTMMSTPQEEAGEYDTWYTKTWSKSDFFVVYGSTPGSGAVVRTIAIDAGWQGTPATNPGAQVTDLRGVYIDGYLVSKPGIIVKVAGAGTPNFDILDFCIRYSFAIDIYPGDYVIRTDILPVGPTEVTYVP